MDLDLIRALRTHLEVTLEQNINNESVKLVLSRLQAVEGDLIIKKQNMIAWRALLSELLNLQKDGIWGMEEDHMELLERIRKVIERLSDEPPGPQISIQTSSSPISVQVHLPPELLAHVNEAFYFHSLATDPSKYLPPGKSLLSIFSKRSQKDDSQAQKRHSLREQVSEAVTRAFWDEAFESLASPIPAVQLSRLRLLYNDLHTALKPLIPSSYPIMGTLSDPLSPTSAPLQSATSHLRELLSVLRERCAPIRDAELDALSQRLKNPALQELPKVCVDVIKGIIHITDYMKEDLADFVLGTWTEKDARLWIKHKAIDVERRTVLDMFPSHLIRQSYYEWLGQVPQEVNKPISRLVKAIGSSIPVSPFPPSENLLPPPLIFSASDLLKLQNLLQALVILVSLRSLIRIPPEKSSMWTSRIWTLIEIEAEKNAWEPVETRLINLEDEVILAAGVAENSEDASRLRDAVQISLRMDSPTFLLLRSRLLASLEERLTEAAPLNPVQVPIRLRTGISTGIETNNDEGEPQERDLNIKGFDDPIMKLVIKMVVTRTRRSLEWLEDCWGDYLK